MIALISPLSLLGRDLPVTRRRRGAKKTYIVIAPQAQYTMKTLRLCASAPPRYQRHYSTNNAIFTASHS